MSVDMALRDKHPAPAKAPAPRVLVVGGHPGLELDDLRHAVEVTLGTVDDALQALRANAVDVILLDGDLPGEAFAPVLELTEDPGEVDRPVVIILAQDRRTNVPSHLVERVDDFVNAFRGSEVLLARIGRALRTRAGLRELARKNGELATLYGRLEGLAGRMAEELRLAAHLQRSLLPPALQHSRIEVAREFLPFREIGGDYYDLIPLGPDRVVFAIGDVMGKGVPAALLAANLKACLRAQLQGAPLSPGQLVARVNRLFWEVTPKGLFASLVFALFDFTQDTLHYVNAGHDYPFLVSADGSVRDLVEGGTVLGLVEDSVYEHGQVRLSRGDTVVFYSDGVTDRANALGEAYGSERLKEAAARSRGDGARIALYSLIGEAQGWADGVAPEDDMTLVVAKVL